MADSSMVDYTELAQQVAQKLGTGIDWRLIYAQWRLETNDFTNWGATVANNLGGMKQFKENPPGIDATSPEGDNYQIFNDLNDYADYYARYLSKYFPDAAAAQNPDDFAAALKAGGYYGGDQDSYIANLKAKLADFTDYKSSGGQTYSTTGKINSLPQGKADGTTSSWVDQAKDFLFKGTTRVLKFIAGAVLLVLGAFIFYKGQPQKVINMKEGE